MNFKSISKNNTPTFKMVKTVQKRALQIIKQSKQLQYKTLELC